MGSPALATGAGVTRRALSLLEQSETADRGVLRIGFLMEQTLGHVAYTRNLQAAFAADPRLAPSWLPVLYRSHGLLDRAPVLRRNWALRGSLRAFDALHSAGGARRFDALLFHTQTVALAAPLAGHQTPVIVSLDATPANLDRVAAGYAHGVSRFGAVERAKRAQYRRTFRHAAAFTTWSQWAKDSLRDDYGVDPDLVTVVAPGVDLTLFPFGTAPRQRPAGARVRILFVGGDFARKGGPLLLDCMRAGLADYCDLEIVTQHEIPPTPGVHAHLGLGPNDPRLLALYAAADIFALPTDADCLAVVTGEAMAAGLPVVTTTVGAQPEAVQHGRSGILIAPGDGDALGCALKQLVGDAALRRDMGRAGRGIAEARFDVRVNAQRLLGVIDGGIARHRRIRTGRATGA